MSESKSEHDFYQNSIDIFARKYKGGIGSPQKGTWLVTAGIFDENGNVIGGGWVESFNTRAEADACAEEIERIDPRQNPGIDKVEH